MEKNIILKDSVNISDSKIRGIVVLEREDGTIVFKKENMIVEGGRNYIKNIFFTKVSGGTEDRKIYTLKFGTNTDLTEVADTDLKANVSAYTINTDSLQWRKITLEDQEDYDEGESFPEEPEENDLFLNDNGNFYIYTKAMIVSQLNSPEIGVKISAILRGTDAQQLSISELGLFLDDAVVGPPAVPATMFSRLVFDGFPLTTDSAYILSYYIYF
jgi:hypothetical protein